MKDHDRNAFMLFRPSAMAPGVRPSESQIVGFRPPSADGPHPLDPAEPQPSDGYCIVCGIIVCALLAAGGLGLYLGWPDRCDRRAQICELR